MLHTIKKLFSLTFALTLLLPAKALCFGGRTHSTITRSAFVKTKFFSKFNNLEEKLKLKKVLLKACNEPDTEEKSWIFKWHFYNPMPTTYNKIEDFLTTKDNALLRTVMHYRKAIKLFNTNKVESIRELGASLHYMQDLCCPVHLLGWSNWQHNKPDFKSFKRVHTSYENEMDEKSYGFEFDVFFEENSNVINLEFDDIEGIVNSYPLATWNKYKNFGQNEPTYEVFKNAHIASWRLLRLFFKEV